MPFERLCSWKTTILFLCFDRVDEKTGEDLWPRNIYSKTYHRSTAGISTERKLFEARIKTDVERTVSGSFQGFSGTDDETKSVGWMV